MEAGLGGPLTLLSAQAADIQALVDAEHWQVPADATCACMDALSLSHARGEGLRPPPGGAFAGAGGVAPVLCVCRAQRSAAQTQARESFKPGQTDTYDVQIEAWCLLGSRQVLGRVTQARTKAYQRLLKTTGIREFAYAESMQRPAHLDPALWDERAGAWAQALSKDEALLLSMKGAPAFVDPSQLELHYGSRGARADRLAQNTTLCQCVQHEQISIPRMSDFRLRREGEGLLAEPGSALSTLFVALRQAIGGILFSPDEVARYVGLLVDDIPWNHSAQAKSWAPAEAQQWVT